jgi:hypothetical protein
MKDKTIDPSEVAFAKVRVDPCGAIFRWQGRIFRAIRHEMVAEVAAMFSCGMIGELVEQRLFPPSCLTDYTIEGYGLVVEHEAIPGVTYPFEWSFGMLKDAALTVLEVNMVAAQYGYETKDCHPHNVCFDGAAPLFVDLGSFIRVGGKGAWACHDEFLRCYCYPLTIWSHGNSFMARRLLCSLALTDTMPEESYLLYRYPLLRRLKATPLRRVVAGRRLLATLFGRRGRNFAALRDRVGALRLKENATTWGAYHDAYHDESGEPLPSRRFQRVVELLQGCGAESVVELGGNQGAFSELLLKSGQVSRVICTDYDEKAVDVMYGNARRKNLPLTTALVDIMYPLMNYYESPPFERLRCDVVVVLAVTHHLVLGQQLPIELFFEIAARYTRRYAFIEFMPLGLWSGEQAPPVPEWYTMEWFQAAFEKQFTLQLVEELDTNRVLFVGEIRA